ncbi:MAG: hypothetical protein AB7U07_07090 [Thermoleophilia bacterium]
MRALVIDQGMNRGSLAAVRALCDDGWTVGVGAPFPSMAGRSRATARWHFVPAAAAGIPEYVEAVKLAVAAGGYEVVFSSDDIGVLALSLNRDELDVVVPYAPHDAVVRSLDKLEMTRAAEKVGLGVPTTREADDATLAAVDRPVMVKARLHSVLKEGAPGRLDVAVARTPDEARVAVRANAEAGVGSIIQEVIDGDLMSFQAVVGQDGELFGCVQQLTPRIWPPGAGSAARSETVEVDADLACRVERFFDELGWFGLAQLQFIAPTDGGPPRLIDLNGRFYGSLSLAIASGPNLPAVWARLALGQGLCTPPLSEPGRSFQWFSRDLRASWHHGGLPGAMGAVAATAASVHSVWRLSDPWPGLTHYGAQVRRALVRKSHALMHLAASLFAGERVLR